jgi:predicted  nucleic acid-binding Zn-ribbon protein
MLETIQHLNSIKQNVSNFKKVKSNQNEDYDQLQVKIAELNSQLINNGETIVKYKDTMQH